MVTAELETKELLETPVAPGIVRRSDRGLCVAGTKISLFFIMDYVKAGQQQDLLTYVGLSEEQLDQALAYIEQHRIEFEANYAEYVRKADEMERYYREREHQRRAELEAKGLWPPTSPPPNLPPHLIPAWERLQALRREGKI
ncbi:MAG: DUF433 domain-containing protein [Blastocatellia bacterium]